MPKYIDQLNRAVEIADFPKRIISLVPSQTEFLYDIGLGERLLGLTKFCVHPAHWKKEKAIIGGTKNFRFDVIDELKPDLIIGNKEENYQEGIERLSEKYPVWMSDIYTLEDAFAMMDSLGEILQLKDQALNIIAAIKKQREAYAWSSSPLPTAAYLIWKDPYMAAGPQTFIHHLMGEAGFRNVIEQPRYPEIALEEIRQLSPNFLLLSSEPYPFKGKHLQELQQLLPQTTVKIVDGELFSWYGSRLLHSFDYFRKLIH